MRNQAMLIPPGLQTASSPAPANHTPSPYYNYISHSSGQRIYTPAVSVLALRQRYTNRSLTAVTGYTCDLLAFAQAGNAVCTPVESSGDLPFGPLNIRQFVAPDRRHSDEAGAFFDQVVFAIYEYKWEGKEFLVYVEDSRDGMYQAIQMFYILGAKKEAAVGEGNDPDADKLVEAASRWLLALHEEVLVFDQGWWQKDKALWKSIQAAKWDDVILNEDKKKALQDDVSSFFESEEAYKEFEVPWKRGLIFYGPPGNGKTISIKALMNSAGQSTNPTVEMLYVKSFSSWMGPEGAMAAIFQKARQLAPCMLIFEDIDSLVTIPVRSYFLNAVDGLESNHGILMVGSTNHLERLDPGIAKRPSRFDRKYFFSMPDRDERVQYAQYWRNKLKGNKKVDFPEELCGMIADITEKFSFAYLKEAFVAALLSIVVTRSDGGKGKAEDTLLWKAIKAQIKILREEMEDETVDTKVTDESKEETALPLPPRDYLHRQDGFSRGGFSSGGLEMRGRTSNAGIAGPHRQAYYQCMTSGYLCSPGTPCNSCRVQGHDCTSFVRSSAPERRSLRGNGTGTAPGKQYPSYGPDF